MPREGWTDTVIREELAQEVLELIKIPEEYRGLSSFVSVAVKEKIARMKRESKK